MRNSVFWRTSPSKNYSESGLFDLVGVDLLRLHIIYSVIGIGIEISIC